MIKEPALTKPKDSRPEVLRRKGKELMVESPKPLTQKDQIRLDEELAKQL